MTSAADSTPSRAGQVALVTGGASGIGAAVVRRLAAAGARVAVSDLPSSPGNELAEEVGGVFLPGDVTDPATSEGAVAAVMERWGRLDVVHLNAGVTTHQPAVELVDLDSYRRVVGVNQDAVFFGLRAALPVMRGRGGGSVVATASLAGLVGEEVDPVYTMTKHAVVGLVRAVGPRLGREGIRVNAVCPGFVDTPLIAGSVHVFRDAGFPLLAPDDVADAVMAVLGSGRSGECWFVQPGRPSEPFRFRGVPGARAGEGAGLTPPDHVGDA